VSWGCASAVSKRCPHWAKDYARNLDHYLYGALKESWALRLPAHSFTWRSRMSVIRPTIVPWWKH
jgi:hypothetical protein